MINHLDALVTGMELASSNIVRFRRTAPAFQGLRSTQEQSEIANLYATTTTGQTVSF